MATAPRPGSTPNAHRKAAQDATITLVLDGERYTLRLGEMSPLDNTACRRETGFSPRFWFEAASKDPDIDVAAAIVWLARRQRGDEVSFADVAEGIGYDTVIEAAEDEAEEDPSSPEA